MALGGREAGVGEKNKLNILVIGMLVTTGIWCIATAGYLWPRADWPVRFLCAGVMLAALVEIWIAGYGFSELVISHASR